MKPPVLIGSSIPAGVDQLRLHTTLKQGDIVLTLIPREKDEALAVARYCRENKIYLCFSEFLHRGSYDLCWAYREMIPREAFHSKADIDEIIDAAGEYYFGRVTVGEIGGVLYWPKAYTINRRAENWENLPPCETHAEAQRAYVDYCKKWLDYERGELGKGPLMNVDSSIVHKYHVMAGIDVLCLEVMPGDPHLMHAAIRGAARAFNKPWGAHIAMHCYGGMNFDRLYEKRWRTSLFFSYIAGAGFIYPESGHYTYANAARGQQFGFHSKEMKRIRRSLREAWQFARIHMRPPNGPRVCLAVAYGHLDGAPGLWNRYAWGQYGHDKWLEGPAERGWRFVDKFHRKEDWPKETLQGDMDFSGNPPYGQYDVAPIEAPLDVLKQYSCLVFLGWNTMTPQIYEKLKAYVEAGGHLVMYLAHLSTHTDRENGDSPVSSALPARTRLGQSPFSLYNNGDFSDLFGVRVTGEGEKDVRGVKCMADSSLKSYRFPLWRVSTDPRLMGNMTPAKVELTTGKVISGHSDFYYLSQEELARQPVLIENSLGRGKAFLVAVREYPGDEGMAPFTDDLLRVVLQGEQGDIRLLSNDRVRYAVYDGRLPASKKRYSVVYLLNTDPDNAATARLWVKGRLTQRFDIPANDLRLAYLCGPLVLIPEDKCVDLQSWHVTSSGYRVDLFTARAQQVEAHNVGTRNVAVTLNGVRRTLSPGDSKRIRLKKRVDPARSEFFSTDFLDEPAAKYKHSGLPY